MTLDTPIWRHIVIAKILALIVPLLFTSWWTSLKCHFDTLCVAAIYEIKPIERSIADIDIR